MQAGGQYEAPEWTKLKMAVIPILQATGRESEDVIQGEVADSWQHRGFLYMQQPRSKQN